MKKAVLLPLVVAISGVTLIGISAIVHAPLLVWNASASAPIGLGKIVARQIGADRTGRPMPRWNECRALSGDEIFLILPPTGSFDSRYFGPVPRGAIIGRLAPLWTE